MSTYRDLGVRKLVDLGLHIESPVYNRKTFSLFSGLDLRRVV